MKTLLTIFLVFSLSINAFSQEKVSVAADPASGFKVGVTGALFLASGVHNFLQIPKQAGTEQSFSYAVFAIGGLVGGMLVLAAATKVSNGSEGKTALKSGYEHIKRVAKFTGKFDSHSFIDEHYASLTTYIAGESDDEKLYILTDIINTAEENEDAQSFISEINEVYPENSEVASEIWNIKQVSSSI